jgi:hypothetical protein
MKRKQASIWTWWLFRVVSEVITSCTAKQEKKEQRR